MLKQKNKQSQKNPVKRVIKTKSRGRTPEGDPNPIDVHVGNRIKLRRCLLGWSQEKLADLLGVTFQQVQKYERGSNRVGASRLWDLSKVLNVPVDFFYADMNKEIAKLSPRYFSRPDLNFDLFDRPGPEVPTDPMMKEETIELVCAYYKIPNRQAAQSMHNLILSLSKSIFYDPENDLNNQ